MGVLESFVGFFRRGGRTVVSTPAEEDFFDKFLLKTKALIIDINEELNLVFSSSDPNIKNNPTVKSAERANKRIEQARKLWNVFHSTELKFYEVWVNSEEHEFMLNLIFLEIGVKSLISGHIRATKVHFSKQAISETGEFDIAAENFIMDDTLEKRLIDEAHHTQHSEDEVLKSAQLFFDEPTAICNEDAINEIKAAALTLKKAI